MSIADPIEPNGQLKEEEDNSRLFFKLYRNCVIKNIIYKHIQIYRKHSNKAFKDIKQLRGYGKREYIENLFLELVNSNEDLIIRKDDIPKSVRYLKIMSHQYQSTTIESLPLNHMIVKLKIMGYFKNAIGINVLPLTLKELILVRYNFSIKEIGILPNGLENLEFTYYNYEIGNGCIPDSVLSIKFNGNYEHDISHILPKNLQYLQTGKYNNFEIKPYSLPTNLKKIKIGWGFQNKNKPIEKGAFPNSIESLEFTSYFDTKIKHDAYPTSLKYLKFGRHHYTKVTNLQNCLNLESLTFGHKYDFQIPVGLLNNHTNLKTLRLGSRYNSIILPNSLPNSITLLKLGVNYNQEIDIATLPKSLKTIIFNKNDKIFNSIVKQLSKDSTIKISNDNHENDKPIVTINL